MTPQEQLAQLWETYMSAATAYEQLRINWSYTRQAALSDGTAGQLYSQVYVAEKAKDDAWTAWDAQRKLMFPAPPTN